MDAWFLFLGIATVWTAGATIAFRGAMALPLAEPLLTALAALVATISYRLVVADRIMAAQIVQQRAREAEMASAAAIQRVMLPSLQPVDVTAKRSSGHFEASGKLVAGPVSLRLKQG